MRPSLPFLTVSLILTGPAFAADVPAWVEPMKEVHAGLYPDVIR